MDELNLNRNDLRKLITISLIVNKLRDAYSQLSEETRTYLNAEIGFIDLSNNLNKSIEELKKIQNTDYKYKNDKRKTGYSFESYPQKRPK